MIVSSLPDAILAILFRKSTTGPAGPLAGIRQPLDRFGPDTYGVTLLKARIEGGRTKVAPPECNAFADTLEEAKVRCGQVQRQLRF